MSEPTREFDGEGGLRFLLAPAFHIEARSFRGRRTELDQCFACWGYDSGTKSMMDDLPALNFRLEGPPGVGKNEIVYELARQIERPLYVIQGHEELTPEDLALVLVPNVEQGSDGVMRFGYHASPLVTALRKGALFFFDEINRVPERTLAPLASVLDDRRRIYSALVARDIGPPDEATRNSFRFCCAMNPQGSARGALPDYIDERTLPVIRVDYMTLEDLAVILKDNLRPPKALLDSFCAWYKDEAQVQLSARQARTLVQYAMSIAARGKASHIESIREASTQIGAKPKKGSDDEEDSSDAESVSDDAGSSSEDLPE